MILLHDVNNNILISRLSYSGVYQYEAKNETLPRDKEFSWVGTNPPPKLKKMCCTLLIQ